MVSAEDSILSKLQWGAPSKSDHQLRDIVNIMQRRWNVLDWPYIEKWVETFGIQDYFEVARRLTSNVLENLEENK